MKTVIMVVLIASCAIAKGTTFDIGPAGTDYTRSSNFGQLNGVTMNGQTVSFDLNFNNNVHLFQRTDPGFLISLVFQTNGADNTGYPTGTGWLLDGFGQQMCGDRTLAGVRNTAGVLGAVLFPFSADQSGLPATDISRPLDFYGLHLEITFPDTGLIISSGTLDFMALDFTQNNVRTQPFRVGPHVPDNGSTFLLFGVGIVALWLGRFDRTTKQTV